MNLDEVTLADLLKKDGYATGCFGKWHNGSQCPYHPNGRGFDEKLYLRENSHLMKRLLRFGRYCFIARTPAITSMRRYDSQGTGEMVRLWLKVWWQSLVSDISNKTYEDMEQEAADRRYARMRMNEGARKAAV